MNDKKQKNLVAENELYKGAFRTPLALIFGGPAGVVMNTAYTAYKVHKEIKDANEFEEKIREKYHLGKNSNEIREETQKRLAQKEIEENVKKEKIEQIKNQLRNYWSDVDMSKFDTALAHELHLFKAKTIYDMSAEFTFYSSEQRCHINFFSEHYNHNQINEFYNIFQEDLKNNNVGEMYFINKNEHTTWIVYKQKKANRNHDYNNNGTCWISTIILGG